MKKAPQKANTPGIEPLTILMKTIGYEFNNPQLLEQALRHKSAGQPNNERLEFLGDAVLGMVIADYLFNTFPKTAEGRLTRMRSSIVKGETLAEVAREKSLGQYLSLGSGELKSGGKNRTSILEDMVEAIIGAIYLDGGMEPCRAMLLDWFEPRLEALDPKLNPKDPKTQLQEHLQALKHPLPEYDVVDITGAEHKQTFTVRCTSVLLQESVEGVGSSRRKAEQAAAKRMLELLSVRPS